MLAERPVKRTVKSPTMQRTWMANLPPLSNGQVLAKACGGNLASGADHFWSPPRETNVRAVDGMVQTEATGKGIGRKGGGHDLGIQGRAGVWLARRNACTSHPSVDIFCLAGSTERRADPAKPTSPCQMLR